MNAFGIDYAQSALDHLQAFGEVEVLQLADGLIVLLPTLYEVRDDTIDRKVFEVVFVFCFEHQSGFMSVIYPYHPCTNEGLSSGLLEYQLDRLHRSGLSDNLVKMSKY